MRRKGELSPSRVDREWPHQIMLSADECLGQQYNVIAPTCPCVREGTRSSYRIAGNASSVLQKKRTPRKFQARFGGEWFDPAQRGRGSNWMKVRPPKQKFY